MEIKKITREEAAKLPLFKSYAESRKYFKSKYGDAFQLEESFIVGDGANATVCYRYSFVLDRDVYEKGIRQLASSSMADAGDFLASYQTIEIMLNGDVHVIF